MLFDWCVQHVQYVQNGAFIARRRCAKHKRAITARIIYALEKTIYGLKKTIYGLKRLYLRVEKDYLRLWPGFFRIVSLFLITWRTFNQSMNKNIWMPYIIVAIPQYYWNPGCATVYIWYGEEEENLLKWCNQAKWVWTLKNKVVVSVFVCLFGFFLAFSFRVLII